MKKSILIYAISILAFLASIAIVNNVYAADDVVNANDENTLKNALSDGNSIINLSKDVTYNVTNCTINNDVTINGNGATIKGEISIEGNAKTVNLNDLTITASSSSGNNPELIKVKTKTNLNVSKVRAYVDDINDASKFTKSGGGIVLYGTDSDASGSTVDILDSTIHAKYAVWIEGGSNDVTITNSNLAGYAALDLTSSSVENGVSNNKITVEGSTLKGYALGKTEQQSNYGTIVIGNQKDVDIKINNSTVTNDFSISTEARSDLILISNYSDEDNITNTENVNVDVKNSVLKNNAPSEDKGAVYNSNETDNNFRTENTEIEGYLLPDEETRFYVDFVIDGKSGIVFADKNGKINPEDIPSGEKEGYRFDGWFNEDGTSFNAENTINANITVTAKYTSNLQLEVEELEKKLQELTKIKNELEKAGQTAKEDNEKLTKELNETTKKLTELKGQLDALKDTTVSKEEMEEVTNALEEVQKSLKQLQNQYADLLDAYEALLAESKAEDPSKDNNETEKGELDEEAKTKTGVVESIIPSMMAVLSFAGAVISKKYIK